MLCSPQAATFSSSFSADENVPDSHPLVGTVEAGLRKCRPGRSSCLPVSATPVGDERGSTAHLRPASLGPHALITFHWPRAQDRRGYCSRWSCLCTRPLMELRRHTRVNWFVSPIYLVDVPSALPGPTVC